MTAAPATARFGPYTVIERLGTGGMCEVYRARRDDQSFDCALKVLKDERRKDERMVDLFITESDLALLVDHPNLIRTYDAGEIGGRHFIAMELVEGATLETLHERCVKRGFWLPIDVSLFAVSEVLEGLQSLHTATGTTGRQLGLIHRDVTPHNIFLSFDGRVILGDFGVALIQAYGDTDPGQVLGKLGYLAPEMILMEEVDLRADLFSAGIVLYELLTGERLFEGQDEEKVMADIADARVPKPRRTRPAISRALETDVLKALSRKPRDRFENAEEMIYALDPHWSKKIGNPFALAGLLAATFPAEAKSWRTRRAAQEESRRTA